jgi:TPR repeat protein
MKSIAVVLGAFALILSSPRANADDCVDSAVASYESGELGPAAKKLERGAREGDVVCMHILGTWYLSGTGVEQDYEAGHRWLKKAAEEELPTAQANLGVLYASGIGVEKNDTEAARWYLAAAEHGDALGQVSLGAAYFLGVGTGQDPVEAFKWTSLAAAQGNERARTYLPTMRAKLTERELERAQKEVASFEVKAPALRPADVERLRRSSHISNRQRGALNRTGFMGR